MPVRYAILERGSHREGGGEEDRRRRERGLRVVGRGRAGIP